MKSGANQISEQRKSYIFPRKIIESPSIPSRQYSYKVGRSRDHQQIFLPTGRNYSKSQESNLSRRFAWRIGPYGDNRQRSVLRFVVLTLRASGTLVRVSRHATM